MKILLIADVGTNTAGFYHIGDEAMLLQTVRWYQKQPHKIKLGILSRSKTHAYQGVTEYLHLPFPHADFWLASPWYCTSLILRFLLHRSTGLPVMRKTELRFIQIISEFDCLHFSGGGNIYSYHAPWLYYVFFLLFLGKQFSKKIWLTSQTIGPFNWFDGILAKAFLRLSDVIVLRSQSTPLPWKTLVGLDAAYDLPILDTLALPKKTPKTLRIGLSLHDWQSFGPKITQTVAKALNQLGETQLLEVIVIPHVLTRSEKTWDFVFMTAITEQLSRKIKVSLVRPQEILKTLEPALYVKTVTAELDLMIATRYHGLVFALSSNVPVVTFELDKYYIEKNSQLLAMVYQSNWQQYLIDLYQGDAAAQLVQVLLSLRKKMVREKELLKVRNKRLHNKFSSSKLDKEIKSQNQSLS